MRKSLIALAALLALALGTFAAVPPAVDARRDDVTLEGRTICGDPAAARGLTVETEANYNGYLHWAMETRLGETQEAGTDFTFTTQPTYDFVPSEPYLYVQSAVEHVNAYGGNLAPADSGGLYRQVQAVLSRTPNGEARTETVDLSGLEYLPLRCDGQLSEGYVGWGTTELWLTASSFFRIPVPDGAAAEITVVKDPAGQCVELRTAPNDAAWVNLDSFSIFDEAQNGFYLALCARDAEGKALSLADIPPGYGIYFLPMRQTYRDDWGATVWMVDGLKAARVFAVDPAAEIVGLDRSEDGRQLLLRTREEDEAWLTVIDRAAMTAVQRLRLPGSGDYHAFWSFGDCVAAMDGSWNFTLWQQADGTYQERLRANLEPAELGGEDLVLAYDGQRLALVRYENWSNSFRVAVCDGEGLRYAAAFESSLDWFVGANGSIRPGELPPALRWDEKTGL